MVGWPLSRMTLNWPLWYASTTSPSISIFSSLLAMSSPPFVGTRRSAREPRALRQFCLLADRNDVGRHRALLALCGLVLDLRALGQGLEARTGDVAEVHEEVLAALLRRDEAEALGVVEPLDGSCCHENTSSRSTHERVRRRWSRPNSL